MDPQEFAAAFSSKTNDEKKEDFERSTLSLVLKQLGASIAQVRGWENELGPEYSMEWFNRQCWLSPHLYTERCFNFNFEQLFTAPVNHPITKMFQEKLDAAEVDGIYVIFKVFDVGRMIATNIKLDGLSYIHVQSINPYNVVSFRNFFRDKYGVVIE